MEEKYGHDETLNNQEEEVLETSYEESDEQQEGESLEELKARLAKAEELANNQKIRAEKAEKRAKQSGFEPTQSQAKGELTTNDLYALMEAKVPQEDINDVQDYAKLKGITIAEALKVPLLKSILSEKSEKRKTAEATHTGTTRRGASKLSDDALLDAAKKGNLSNLSDDDIMRLAGLRG